jgi:hypothetical protein
MSKYMVFCLLFCQSAAVMASQALVIQKSVKRTSGPKQEDKSQQSAPMSCKRRSGEKSPREDKSCQAGSPFEFSPTTSLGTVYYGGVFGALNEQKDFSPVCYSSK